MHNNSCQNWKIDKVIMRSEDDPHQVGRFQTIQLPPSPPKKDSKQKLLEKNTDRPLFSDQEREQIPKHRKDIKITSDLDYRGAGELQSEFCFPKFLSDLGACCTPCYIFCKCCFCECCPCTTNPLFTQQMTSLGLVQEWGRFKEVLDPGLHVINPISQSVIQINQQTQMLEYQQICISKDNVQFHVNVMVFYRIFDTLKAAYRLGDVNFKECVIQIANGTLRSICGENILQEIIENRDLVSQKFAFQLNRVVNYWGIFIEVSSLKDIQINKQIQQALQTVTETRRRTEALLINFRAEVSCASLYRQISEILNTKAAFQIRYLKTVEQIINNNNDNMLIIKTQLKQTTFEEEQDPLIKM